MKYDFVAQSERFTFVDYDLSWVVDTINRVSAERDEAVKRAEKAEGLIAEIQRCAAAPSTFVVCNKPDHMNRFPSGRCMECYEEANL